MSHPHSPFPNHNRNQPQEVYRAKEQAKIWVGWRGWQKNWGGRRSCCCRSCGGGGRHLDSFLLLNPLDPLRTSGGPSMMSLGTVGALGGCWLASFVFCYADSCVVSAATYSTSNFKAALGLMMSETLTPETPDWLRSIFPDLEAAQKSQGYGSRDWSTELN